MHRITLNSGKKAFREGRFRCKGLYERIGGFKAKHMTPKRGRYYFDALLERRPDGTIVPIHVWGETRFGRISAELE